MIISLAVGIFIRFVLGVDTAGLLNKVVNSTRLSEVLYALSSIVLLFFVVIAIILPIGITFACANWLLVKLGVRKRD